MKKKIYAIYDEKASGIPGQIWIDFNDSVVTRALAEQHKEKPISKELANDLVLLCLGEIDIQSDITNTGIEANTRVVGKYSDFLSVS